MPRIDELNPQAEQMADESMVRNLAAQAEAIWPQERPIFELFPVGSSRERKPVQMRFSARFA